MNLVAFQHHCAELAEQRKEIVDAKRPEYTEGDVDVLNNFKTIAKELDTDPLQVWYVYFRKHIASIGQYCKDQNRQSEPIDGRICDAMNYLELFYGLIKDKEARKGDGVPAENVPLWRVEGNLAGITRTKL